MTVEADVDSIEKDGTPPIAAELVGIAPAQAQNNESARSAPGEKVTRSGLNGLNGLSGACIPVGPGAARALAVLQALLGADSENRSSALCYIRARHDLDAVRPYLNRCRHQPKKLRAYTKELERLLLWAVVLRGKALSDLRVDDCEAYKDFLKSPDPRFVGERFVRSSPRW